MSLEPEWGWVMVVGSVSDTGMRTKQRTGVSFRCGREFDPHPPGEIRPSLSRLLFYKPPHCPSAANAEINLKV
jgi:hypothetical protein